MTKAIQTQLVPATIYSAAELQDEKSSDHSGIYRVKAHHRTQFGIKIAPAFDEALSGESTAKEALFGKNSTLSDR